MEELPQPPMVRSITDPRALRSKTIRGDLERASFSFLRTTSLKHSTLRDGFRDLGNGIFLKRAYLEESVRRNEDLQQLPWYHVFLWTTFGMSGWWGFNGITAELPLLIHDLPQKETLGSQLGLLCQVGALALIFYGCFDKVYRFKVNAIKNIIVATTIISVINLVVCAMTWRRLFHGRSVALFVTALIAGGVGCLSMSTFYAFASDFPKVCMKYMGIGSSLGGIVVQGFAALQMQSESNTNMVGVSSFLLIVAAMQLLFLGSLMLIMLTKNNGATNGHTDQPLLTKTSVASPLPPLPSKVRFCYVAIFLIVGINYALPALIPYLALVDPSAKRLVLLRIGNAQQWGETLGRMLAPGVEGFRSTMSTLVAAFWLFAGLLYLILLILHPAELTSGLPDHVVDWMIPFLVFTYVCAYGIGVSGIRVFTRSVVSQSDRNPDRIARVQSRLGFCSQLGALSANLITFACVNLGRTFCKSDHTRM